MTSVDAFLAAVRAGAGIPATLYASDATVDATVPGWRFALAGPAAIVAEYDKWFAAAGRFEELERRPFADGSGELVTYLLAWEEDGVPHAGRHAHVLVLDESGLIRSDTVFCGGRWPAALLAEMAEAAQ